MTGLSSQTIGVWRRLVPMGLRFVLLIASATTLGLIAAACGGGQSDQSGEPVRVFAAASLTDAFADLAAVFEAENPGTEVELNLAGSSSLRAQIEAGAPADVFASAGGPVMDQVADVGSVVGRPQPFAVNSLTIAVPVGNPGGIEGIADFADDELFLGLCASTVPCGALADRVLSDVGVVAAADTREPDVRALLTKVAEGELDAGLVYRTDVLAAADVVEGIELPAGVEAGAAYPIAALDQGNRSQLGSHFVEFVLSDRGQAILADHGFAAP